jgi:predicted ABC-class ATPase
MTTLVTLATGRTIEVAMTYADAKAYLGITGKREVTTTCGTPITLDTDLVKIIEAGKTKHAIGFR